MAKETTPSFVLTIEMKTNQAHVRAIESDLEISRIIYNSCLGELLKREKQMNRAKKYQKLRRCLRVVSQKLSYYEDQKNEEEIKFYKNEKNIILEEIFAIQRQFGLTEYAMHAYIKPIRKHFGNTLNASVAQKMATRAWNTFYKKLKGQAKKVRFIKRDDMYSFEGKSNHTGWRYNNHQIVFEKSKIDLKINEKDLYMQEALSNIEQNVEFEYKTAKGETKKSSYKVKYVRILKRVIRGKTRYFIQLTLQGFPPPKRNKDGSFKHKIGKGRVGGDLGTSSIAVVGESQVLLTNLANEIENKSQEIKLLQRKMDRSKRASNPGNFREDGMVKKGRKKWVFSNRYYRLKANITEMHRKQAVIRKLSHNNLANKLLSFGDKHYWEEMNIKALKKRSRKTEISEKTGKFKRKKRFGKTIGHRAPAMFLTILENKVTAYGGTFRKVNTRTFKASQYDHKSNDYKKKKLKERWHVFDDDTKVQRDLYSAFLLKHSNKSGTRANRKLCIESFESFALMHNKEMNRIEKLDTEVLNSGIQLKNRQNKKVVVAT